MKSETRRVCSRENELDGWPSHPGHPGAVYNNGGEGKSKRRGKIGKETFSLPLFFGIADFFSRRFDFTLLCDPPTDPNQPPALLAPLRTFSKWTLLAGCIKPPPPPYPARQRFGSLSARDEKGCFFPSRAREKRREPLSRRIATTLSLWCFSTSITSIWCENIRGFLFVWTNGFPGAKLEENCELWDQIMSNCLTFPWRFRGNHVLTGRFTQICCLSA